MTPDCEKCGEEMSLEPENFIGSIREPAFWHCEKCETAQPYEEDDDDEYEQTEDATL